MYWAQALAEQTQNLPLQACFIPVAKALTDHIDTIIEEINAVEGKPINANGYYHPDNNAIVQATRPSATFNKIIDDLNRAVGS